MENRKENRGKDPQRKKWLEQTKSLFQNRLLRQSFLTLLSILLTIVLIFATTTAWYNNVLQTGGLNFTSSPWGFEGSVILDEETITAAPGSSGTIPFTVTNPTDQIIAVSVGVSKSLDRMKEEIQSRIYFYADDSVIREGELVDRIYLNSTQVYNYTLLSGQDLVLGSENANNTAIKWEWVYDVVGYYVRATVTTEATPVIEEHLRPVSYDYDLATFDEAGTLLTVDGTTTAAEFLYTVTQTDGYKGTITEDVTPVQGYYPVEVDENGYGVWVYLCNRTEIEYNNMVDTTMGEEQQSFGATLTIQGQQKKLEVTEAASPAELKVALTATEGDIVRLTADVELSESITLAAGAEKILDLNGNTLYTSAVSDLFTVGTGESLTLINGRIEGQNETSKGYAFNSKGGEVTLDGVTMTGMYGAVYIKDALSEGTDSRIYISNSDLTTSDVTLYVAGNGAATGRDTAVVIEDSKINSTGYIGIMGNGSGTVWGTDIQITGSVISGLYAGIYQPQKQSTLTITDSDISGYTAVAIKGGTVRIHNSRITGVANDTLTPAAPGSAASGFTDTGDGVYVETNYGWGISVEITGEETVISSAEGQAVRQYEAEAAHAEIIITSGSYSHDVSAFLPEDGRCTSTYIDGRYVITENS